MALFTFYGKDKTEGAALRDAHRAAHLEHMTAMDQAGRMAFAGPLKESVGGKSVGSLIVFEAESLEAARAEIEADPYTKAGVFEWYEIQPTLKAFPKE
jgi:uncharacterized protein